MSRLASSLLLALSLLALLAVPAHAAAKKPLQVLIIQSDNAVTQAQALTVALKRAVAQSRQFELAEGEFSLEVMSLALGCPDPPDGTCLAQIGAKIKSNQFVWGTMQRDGSKVAVQLHLWRRGASGSELSTRYSSSLTAPDDDALAQLSATLLARLSGEAAPSAAAEATEQDADGAADDADVADEPMGELMVFADDVDGTVVIDGRSYGRLKNGYAKIEVPAGEHELVVRAGGYYEAVAEVEVKVGRRSEVRLYPERRGRPRRGSDSQAKSGGASGAGWAAIVAGGALVGGGVYSTMKVRSINEEPAYKDYRAQFRQNQNVCSEAEHGTAIQGQASPDKIADLCSQARTYEALQYLFFGLGGVAIGTGVLILVTDSGPSDAPEADHGETAVRAQPHVVVGKSGGEVGVRLSF